ncbi:MAG: NUDIX domain-containing protein [Bdellovibrionales bacterium]
MSNAPNLADTGGRPRVGSAGILVEDGKLMMGLSKKWNQWVIPGGAIDFLESYKDAVVREIREETGLEVEWQSFAQVFEVMHAPTNNHRVLLYSNVKRVGGSINPGDDIADVAFFDRAGLAKLADEGLLTGVMLEVLMGLGWLEETAERSRPGSNVWQDSKKAG